MQECVLCKEYITNPLCPSCISEQVKDWLGEKKPELINELSQETEKMTLGKFNENECIKCKGFMDICTYCHTEHILDWLKMKDMPQSEIEEFVKFFHFDLERKGYTRNFQI